MSYQKINLGLNVIAGTTYRNSGYSLAPFDHNNMAFYVGDQKEHVLSNRKKLAAQIQVPLEHWVLPKITHSSNVIEITNKHRGAGAFLESDSIMNCDALYTRESNLLIGVFHADCTAILIYAPDQKIVAAIHAGWPGTCKEITSRVLKILIQKENCDPKKMKIYFAPSITQKNFEIDIPVIEKVRRMSFDISDCMKFISSTHAHMDVAKLNLKQCLNHHVLLSNIQYSTHCTYDQSDLYYSYRKNSITGRHLSFICAKP